MTSNQEAEFAWWRWLRRGGLLLVTVVIVEYLVLPQLISARADMSLLSSAQPLILVVALTFEAWSLLSFSALSRAALPAAGRPTFGTILRIDLTGLGLGHVVPGGGATAAGFRFRLLRRAGVHAEDAISGATIQTAASLVGLVLVFLTGIVLSVPAVLHQTSFLVAGGLSAGLLAAVTVGAVLLTRRRASTLAFVHRFSSRLPRSASITVDDTMVRLGDRVAVLATDGRLLAATMLWAAGNWVLDAVCLWLCLRAYGFSEQVGPLLALYGAASLLSMVPISPGGLGLVEGVLIPALVAVGAPAAVALLGVITWRLMAFWLPIPVAAVTYLTLRLGVLRHRLTSPAPEDHGSDSTVVR